MKEMTCIVCPVGCHLEVEDQDHIKGNRCPRGLEYAKQELIDPKRMVTTTVKMNHPFYHRLSVKTSRPISKQLVFQALDELATIEVHQNVHIGDVIVAHILGTDVDIVATKEVLY
jgi:CxxC motif-containing protein